MAIKILRSIQDGSEEERPNVTQKIKLGILGVCVFITAGPMIKLCAGGEGDSEGHVL